MTNTAIHEHGRELIATSEIAGILNEYFNLPSDTRIDYNLPYMWWYRSKLNHLAHPMPAPTIIKMLARAMSFASTAIIRFFISVSFYTCLPVGRAPSGNRRCQAPSAAAASQATRYPSGQWSWRASKPRRSILPWP